MSPSSNSRRRRVKSRKQRFLSLSRELAATPPLQKPEPALHRKPSAKPRPPAARRRDRTNTATKDLAVKDQPIDFFPVHPEAPQTLEEDDRHAAAFLDPDYYATAMLTSLLGPDQLDDAEAAPEDNFSVPAVAPQHAISPASSSPAVYGAAPAAPRDLARSVLRGRERWVLCQQQQAEEDQEEEGEASSCGGAAPAVDHFCSPWWASSKAKSTQQMCFLKLDYEEVLSAWSGAGSVYVEGEAAQVVPDNHHQHFLLEQPAIFVQVGGSGCGATGSDSSGSNLWVVPEDSGVGGREARVMRYREKRQNRLFAKRIRYEVRKLNAQKRPRIKGRFVKRIQEQA